MKTKIGMQDAVASLFIFLLLLLLRAGDVGAIEVRDISDKTKALVVYHFDEPDIQKKRNVDFGSWELHPSYITDAIVVKPQDPKEAEEFGNILRVEYDVSIAAEDLPYAGYPVFNGVWFHLPDIDLSHYERLVFYARGDSDAGFTRRFKVELKNAKEIGRFYINEVGHSWRRLEIPLNEFKTDTGKPIKSLQSMKELTVVFEKQQVTQKKGVIYLDNIYFSGPKDGNNSAAPPADTAAKAPATASLKPISIKK